MAPGGQWGIPLGRKGTLVADVVAISLAESLLPLARWPRPIIAGIQAGLPDGPIDSDPVGPVDASSVPRGRTDRECGRDLDPAILLVRNGTDLVGNLGEVLILAEDQGDIVFSAVSHADNVEGDPDIDPLLLTGCVRVLAPRRKPDSAIPVSQRARECVNALPAHEEQLVRPEVMPEGIVRGIGNARIEADLLEGPCLTFAQHSREGSGVVVRIGVPEGLPCGVEEVLTVDEGDGPFGRWFDGHCEAENK